MERLYCDASFYRRVGGMAVVGPAWTVERVGFWRARWDVQIVEDIGWDGHVAYYAACRCASCNDAEKRALAMAFLLAYDILSTRRDEKVEVLSDSLIVLNWVMNSRFMSDPILDPMRNLWEKRSVILGKVKGHMGNRGNELADIWARHARLEYGEKLEKQLQRELQYQHNAYVGTWKKHY